MKLTNEEQQVWVQVIENEIPEIDIAVIKIKNYQLKDWYQRKKELLMLWNCLNKTTLKQIIVKIITAVVITDKMSIQALMGKLHHIIELPKEIDRVQILADIVGILVNVDLLRMYSSSGEYHKLSSSYNFVVETEERHKVLVEPPAASEGNHYKDLRYSVILGHPMNHHEGQINLQHINRLNNIPLYLNREFIDTYNEVPKYQLTGRDKEQWDDYLDQAEEQYQHVYRHGVFYNSHSYCYRGRTYCNSYFLNYQGTSFKKAMIEIQEELVTDE